MKALFGVTKEGDKIYAYTLMNKEGMQVTIITLGAIVTSVKVKDKHGKWLDVVLGYDNLPDYEVNACCFGAIVGRNANRIAGGKCVIDGVSYSLEQNESDNNLHSGSKGFQNCIWDVIQEDEDKLVLSYVSRDLEQGFPGTMKTEVTYRVTEDNTLEIVYEAKADKTTIANMTSHVYYNLNGHNSGTIEGHELMLNASAYTPVHNEHAIPTGEIRSVEGTPFDFRTPKVIGQNIEKEDEQLRYANGYDHNFVLDGAEDEVKLAARVIAKESGIVMEVSTDCPGIQCYAGNFIVEHKGKENADYKARQGLALEPQYFPNAVNEANFKSPLLKAGEMYHSETKIHFSVMSEEEIF